MKSEHSMGRRGFLKTATATTAGALLLSPGSALGAEANSKLQLGLIGCGGRGPWIGNFFQETTNTKVVAVHDYFRDRANAAGERLGVEEGRRYVGIDGVGELLNSGVDAVAIISPPYFHTEQTVAALAAGKHVYLAKPIAVDVPGCTAIVDAAKSVAGKLSVWVDFQTRVDPMFMEVAKRIHAGEIGEPVLCQGYYHTGRLNIKTPPGTETARLRNWVFDKALSGDIIVEQNVHVVDVVNWYLQGHPEKAIGTGGRRVRTDVGDCWDHFIVRYHYPNEVLVDFSSSQFVHGFDDICIRLFGSKGSVESHYGGEVYLKNKQGGWQGGKTEQIYRDGAVANM
ncbi:MAG: Gfo/Idh/MocA family oxidoreductase, partial [Candidatus Hydrogenedentales bacterium]